MKNKLPLLLLVVCVLACNKFGPDTTSSTSNKSANASAPAPKVVNQFDLPATLGKTKDEIKVMVNGTPTHEDPWLEYTFETYELTFKFDTKTKKADEATFKFKAIGFGDTAVYGTGTAEQLATMAGIDLKGKAPRSPGPTGDSYDLEFGGKKVDALFSKVSGQYTFVLLSVN